ncbi:MAG: hypothetical protein M3R49_00945 [Chloroflexota bacterium]|nr:hypothetical protein [Chloroflexota bacterium]
MLLATVLFIPGLLFGPPHDADLFVLIGERLTVGEIPYRDLWDNKPPAIYLIMAGAALLPGPTWPVVWGLSVCVTATAGMVFARLASPFIAIIAVAIAALLPVSSGGGMTETFALLPAALAFWFAKEQRAGVWVGLLTAAAVLISPQFVPLLVAVAVLSPRQIPKLAIGFGAGCLAALTLVIAWGALPQAWDAIVTYNSAYRSLPSEWVHLPFTLLALAPLAAYARFERNRVVTAGLLWIGLGAAFVAIQGHVYPHYAIAFVLPLVALAARPSIARSIAAITTLTVLFYVGAISTNWNPNRQLGPISADVGRWVSEHSAPGQRILVWGSAAAIYSISDRPPAGRYPFSWPLSTPGYSTREQVGGWLAGLQADPPAVVVDFQAAASETDRLLPPSRPGLTFDRSVDLLDPVRLWVSQRYRFTTERHGVRLYLPCLDDRGQPTACSR